MNDHEKSDGLVSTREGAEQRCVSGRGGAGGKGPARGERGQQNPDTEPGKARQVRWTACAGSRGRGSTPLPAVAARPVLSAEDGALRTIDIFRG